MSFLSSPSTRTPSTTALATGTTAATVTLGCISLATLIYRNGYHRRLTSYFRSIPPKIYNAVILHMTEVWYREVLGRLDDGSAVLDVGVGTAGALLRCTDLIKSKNLRVVGLDYNDIYIDAAHESIRDAGMDHRIKVVCMSVYDEGKLHRLGDLLDDMDGDGGDDNDDMQLLSGAPPIPPIPANGPVGGGMTLRDRTQDTRVGHHHPHLAMREEIRAKSGTVEALDRTDSEAQSEAASEAERESVLHDLLEANKRVSSKPDFRRMNTPKISNVDGSSDDAAAVAVTAEEPDEQLQTPSAPPGQHDAEHPQDAHDFSPPPTPGRDHDVHWEKEPPMPDFLPAVDSLDSTDGAGQNLTAAAVLSSSKPRKCFDAVYFSGSISLLPDPPAALVLTSRVLKPETGKVYITQTYQRRSPPLLGYLKPLFKFLTTIDFGQLVTEKAILGLYDKADELEVEVHQPIEGSINTALQCAYVSVLKQKEPEDVI